MDVQLLHHSVAAPMRESRFVGQARTQGPPSAASAFTTLMISGIPRRLTAGDIAAELMQYLRPGDFDFIYVPGAGDKNIGLAFVNIPDALLARAVLSGMRLRRLRSAVAGRAMRVGPAHVQGLAANVAHCFARASLRPAAHVPFVWLQGARVAPQVAVRALGIMPEPASRDASPAPHSFRAEVLTDIEFFESDTAGAVAGTGGDVQQQRVVRVADEPLVAAE